MVNTVISDEQRKMLERYVFNKVAHNEEAEQLLRSGDPSLEVLLACQQVSVLRGSGDNAGSLKLAISTLESEQPKTPMESLKLWWAAGTAASALNDYGKIAEYLSNALKLAESQVLPEIIARLKLDFAVLEIAAGDLAKGIAKYEEAIVGLSRYDDTEDETLRARFNIASAYLRANKLDLALEYFVGLANDPSNTTQRKLYPAVLQNLAITYKRLGNQDESLTTYQKLIAAARDFGSAVFEMHALIGITDHYVIVKNLEKARTTISAASKLLGNKHVTHMRNLVQAHMANVAHAEGNLRLAIDGLSIAYTGALNSNDTSNALHYGNDLADWMHKDGDFAGAYAIQRKISQIQQEMSNLEVDRAVDLVKIRMEYDTEKSRIKDREETRNQVLHSVLPKNIAKRLMSGEQHIADRIERATVLFADIVGFTKIASDKDPETLVDILEQLFTGMDEVSSVHDCERIKTIGDAYMAISSSENSQPNHVERMALTALDFADGSSVITDLGIELRVGLHCGPVVAGVMRGARLSYDVWGDTVNVAARMEQLSAPSRVLCSEEVANELAQNSKFTLEKREPLAVRGKGLLTTYWLSRRP